MVSSRSSGEPPFTFSHCPNLRAVPESAAEFEAQLHGGFAADTRPGNGELYYGMPGSGIIRISSDLASQDVLDVPSSLRSTNFHSTKIGEFNGVPRLFLAANQEGAVYVVTLDGEVEMRLGRPEFEEYRAQEVAYVPTDTVPRPGAALLIADGYGSNYISASDLGGPRWTRVFGGKTDDPEEHGKFGTAHGLNPSPAGDRLVIADRPHSRLEVHTFDGAFETSHALPWGSRPCGIDFLDRQGRHLAVVGSLDDPDPNRPAPIYILDGTSFEVLSTIRPKEDLGIELADHIHNVVWHEVEGALDLVCQAWNPGHYFVLRHQAWAAAGTW